MSALPTAVVLAADVNGLGVVRALSLRGVPSIAIVAKPGDAVLYSRVPRASYLVADEGRPGDRLLEFLMTLECGIAPVLIATSDVFMEFILTYRDVLSEKYKFTLPRSEVVSILLDKRNEALRMAELGVAIPRTVVDLHENAEKWFDDLRFPVIVKPRTAELTRTLRAKNRVLGDAKKAREFSVAYKGILNCLIAQEVVGGPDDNQWVCNCTLSEESELTSCFTFQRLRLSPSHFGVTSFAVSRKSEAIEGIVHKIANGMRYIGPAMIEFKWDDQDQKFKYIETNPRLGMCNWLDSSCGVENAYNTYAMAAGLDVVRSREQRQDVVFLSLFADLYARRKDGESLTSAIRHYWQYRRYKWVHAYWLWWDPCPAVVIWSRRLGEVVVAISRRLVRLVLGRSAK